YRTSFMIVRHVVVLLVAGFRALLESSNACRRSSPDRIRLRLYGPGSDLGLGHLGARATPPEGRGRARTVAGARRGVLPRRRPRVAGGGQQHDGRAPANVARGRLPARRAIVRPPAPRPRGAGPHTERLSRPSARRDRDCREAPDLRLPPSYTHSPR